MTHGTAAQRKIWLRTEAGRTYARRSRTAAAAKLKTAFAMFIRTEKARPCVDCGNSFPPCAMDFDHVRGEKLFNLSRGPSRGLLACRREVAKCDLVCANCHRVRTTLRRYGKI